MPRKLSKEYLDRNDAILASDLANKCVQCGFCTATCPTFQITGNELDGPRGRISLIKGVLEGHNPSEITQKHLDRCLLCRNCETTCPSGVEYGNLFSIGKKLIDEKVQRKKVDQIFRWGLKETLTSPLFSFSMYIAKRFRGLLPEPIKSKIPKEFSKLFENPKETNFLKRSGEIQKKVLLLPGCVQKSMFPNINTSTLRLLNNCNIKCITPSNSTCCGAIKAHLNDKKGSIKQVKENIDAWWPFVESNSISSIVINASGCSLEVKKYSELFPESSGYHKKAKKISSLTIDLSEILPEIIEQLKTKIPTKKRKKLAFHPPCTLQHGQKLNGVVENAFTQLGFEISIPTNNSNICCGSAGTYSVLQPKFANILRNNKIRDLNKLDADIIISANVGCISHLQSGTDTPVVHWVEILANELER